MTVKIEKQSDGTYIAYNIDGDFGPAIGTGNTVREAKDDFYNSLRELNEVGDGLGLAPIEEDVEFHFDISSLFEYYSMINISAFARSIGINDSLMRRYKNGNEYISDAQVSRIEQGLHKLGAELSALRLT